MSEFQHAMLLRLRCEMESFVSEREGMVAANQALVAVGDPPRYVEADFANNATALRACAPDLHDFA